METQGIEALALLALLFALFAVYVVVAVILSPFIDLWHKITGRKPE